MYKNPESLTLASPLSRSYRRTALQELRNLRMLTLAAVVVALALAGVVKELLAFLGELGSASGVSADLFVPLYKTIGIALVVQVGGNLCRDAGESALASVVETAGTLCALLAALPLLRAVLDMLLELMG